MDVMLLYLLLIEYVIDVELLTKKTESLKKTRQYVLINISGCRASNPPLADAELKYWYPDLLNFGGGDLMSTEHSKLAY
jgi:hypothetical protein